MNRRCTPKKVLLAGGDRRAFLLSRLLAKRPEFLVYTLKLGETGLPSPEKGFQADVLILPIPVTADGLHLKLSPEEKEPLSISEALDYCRPGGRVYGGLTPVGKGVPDLCRERGLTFTDFLAGEGFTLKNAEATAEIALALAVLALPEVFTETRAVVLGGGRIAKGLVKRLTSLGASCVLAARKEEQRREAERLGARAVTLEQLTPLLPEADVLFNTIPAPVVTGEMARQIPPEALIYELASAPGGFTPEAMEIRKVMPALSLPGRYAPRSCANWLKDEILQHET